MPGPEVSVVIPTRDRPQWLSRTLLSALNQRDVEMEIIIVDDCSRIPVAEQLTPAGLSRVRVLRNPEPRGVSAARNRGIAEAGGEWIALLDDDDVWAPTKLAETMRVAQGGADFAFTGGVAIDERGRVLYTEDPPKGDLHRGALSTSGFIPFAMQNLVIRADLLRSLEGFDTEFAILADWDLLVRLTAVAGAATSDEHLIAYTVHSRGMHGERFAIAEELNHFERKHAEARAAAGVSMDRATWWRWRIGVVRRMGDRAGAAEALLKYGWFARDPANVIRAGVMALGGERGMRIGQWLTRGHGPADEFLDPPRWLSAAIEPERDAVSEIWRARR